MSLFEILVAFAVGTIAIVGVALMLATIWRSASEGKYQAAASNLGRMSVEQMRGDPSYFQQVLATTGPTAMNTTLSVDGVVNTSFHSEIKASPLSGSTVYYDVIVNVTWAQEHRTRCVTLETYLPEP